MSKLTVIVPAYKCHSYLERLLDSIAMQTLSKDNTYEVVVVNDCCPEGSYEKIIKQYRKRMNIREIMCEKNGGPGVARQVGIDSTNGDYIMFADSDDTYMIPKAFEILINAIEDCKYDMIIGNFYEECNDGSIIIHKPDTIWVFAKIYRRSFLSDNNIRFNDSRANEDTGFNKLCECCTDKIGTINSPIYFWCYQPNTITRTNKHKYTYAEGFRGSMYNLSWVAGELYKRGKLDELKEFILKTFPRIYIDFENAWSFDRDEREANSEALRAYFDEGVRKYLDECKIAPREVFDAILTALRGNPPETFYQHTVEDFLDYIEYFKQEEKSND